MSFNFISCVNNGYIYNSLNNATDWYQRASINNWSSITSSNDGTRIAACVNGGYIYTSTNGGDNWIEQTNAGLRNWTSICSSHDGVILIACATNDNIYMSTDSGYNWNSINSNSYNWSDISCSNGGTQIVASVNDGYIYRTNNSGSLWNSQATNFGNKNWSSISLSNNGNHCVACVNGEYIYISTDMGDTWTQYVDYSFQNWSCVSISHDGKDIGACVDGGYIYRANTQNDSSWTWTIIYSNSRNWSSICISDNANNIGACVNGGYIYTSIDTGTNWTEQSNSNLRNWSSITFASPSVCFIYYNKVLLENNTLEEIQHIKRGDMIKTDIKTNSCAIVANVIKIRISNKVVKIPKGLINNTNDIICSELHPIWINNDNNRIMAKNIIGIELLETSDLFYNIQFEDEGSFYVEGIKVDSLSPNHRKYKLMEYMFFNKHKYDKNLFIKNEDDPIRNKPKMTIFFY